MAIETYLTLGPLLFNWPEEKYCDFYYKIADETDFERVYLGEVVCSKRQTFHDHMLPEIVERLIRGGKTVIISTPSLVSSAREHRLALGTLEAFPDLEVELNDISLTKTVTGKPFTLGPYINVYNQPTLNYFKSLGARRLVSNFELEKSIIFNLAQEMDVHLETQVFGRLPLAISARCYHARAHKLHKDGCQFVCDRDPDGLQIDTMEGKSFLCVNGTQTLSSTWVNLIKEIPLLANNGIRRFRLSPHTGEFTQLAGVFRSLIEGKTATDEAASLVQSLYPLAQFSNGFFHGVPGKTCVGND
jgi:collagenase-like PrtC family protease